MKWSSQSRPLAISSIFDGFMACLTAPLVLWVPEGLAACGSLWQPVAGCGELCRPIGCPLLRVWRHRCLLAGGLRLRCPDATLAGWLGWLAGLAGWLQLAGCCWLAAAGWLTEIRKLAWKVVPHARRSREVGGYPAIPSDTTVQIIVIGDLDKVKRKQTDPLSRT